jgi:hypothetical protein
MGKIVISVIVSLAGVVQDPSGDEGFRHGGWVGRITDRPEVGKLAPDEALRTEAMLLGRRTYECPKPRPLPERPDPEAPSAEIASRR